MFEDRLFSFRYVNNLVILEGRSDGIAILDEFGRERTHSTQMAIQWESFRKSLKITPKDSLTAKFGGCLYSFPSQIHRNAFVVRALEEYYSKCPADAPKTSSYTVRRVSGTGKRSANSTLTVNGTGLQLNNTPLVRFNEIAYVLTVESAEDSDSDSDSEADGAETERILVLQLECPGKHPSRTIRLSCRDGMVEDIVLAMTEMARIHAKLELTQRPLPLTNYLQLTRASCKVDGAPLFEATVNRISRSGRVKPVTLLLTPNVIIERLPADRMIRRSLPLSAARAITMERQDEQPHVVVDWCTAGWDTRRTRVATRDEAEADALMAALLEVMPDISVLATPLDPALTIGNTGMPAPDTVNEGLYVAAIADLPDPSGVLEEVHRGVIGRLINGLGGHVIGGKDRAKDLLSKLVKCLDVAVHHSYEDCGLVCAALSIALGNKDMFGAFATPTRGKWLNSVLEDAAPESQLHVLLLVRRALCLIDAKGRAKEAAARTALLSSDLLETLMSMLKSTVSKVVKQTILLILVELAQADGHKTSESDLSTLSVALHNSLDELLALTRADCHGVRRLACMLVRLLLYTSSSADVIRQQARESGLIIYHLGQLFDGVSDLQRAASAQLLAFLCHNHASNMQMLRNVFPAALTAVLDGRASSLFDDNVAVPPADAAPAFPDDQACWALFMYLIQRDLSTAMVEWHAKARMDLCGAIQHEITALEAAGEGVVWNGDEFFVEYQSLSRQANVGPFFLTALRSKLQPLDSVVELLNVQTEAGTGSKRRRKRAPDQKTVTPEVELVRSVREYGAEQLLYDTFDSMFVTAALGLRAQHLACIETVYRLFFFDIGPFPRFTTLCVLLQEAYRGYEADPSADTWTFVLVNVSLVHSALLSAPARQSSAQMQEFTRSGALEALFKILHASFTHGSKVSDVETVLSKWGLELDAVSHTALTALIVGITVPIIQANPGVDAAGRTLVPAPQAKRIVGHLDRLAVLTRTLLWFISERNSAAGPEEDALDDRIGDMLILFTSLAHNNEAALGVLAAQHLPETLLLYNGTANALAIATVLKKMLDLGHAAAVPKLLPAYMVGLLDGTGERPYFCADDSPEEAFARCFSAEKPIQHPRIVWGPEQRDILLTDLLVTMAPYIEAVVTKPEADPPEFVCPDLSRGFHSGVLRVGDVFVDVALAVASGRTYQDIPSAMADILDDGGAVRYLALTMEVVSPKLGPDDLMRLLGFARVLIDLASPQPARARLTADPGSQVPEASRQWANAPAQWFQTLAAALPLQASVAGAAIMTIDALCEHSKANCASALSIVYEPLVKLAMSFAEQGITDFQARALLMETLRCLHMLVNEAGSALSLQPELFGLLGACARLETFAGKHPSMITKHVVFMAMQLARKLDDVSLFIDSGLLLMMVRFMFFFSIETADAPPDKKEKKKKGKRAKGEASAKAIAFNHALALRAAFTVLTLRLKDDACRNLMDRAVPPMITQLMGGAVTSESTTRVLRALMTCTLTPEHVWHGSMAGNVAGVLEAAVRGEVDPTLAEFHFTSLVPDLRVANVYMGMLLTVDPAIKQLQSPEGVGQFITGIFGAISFIVLNRSSPLTDEIRTLQVLAAAANAIRLTAESRSKPRSEALIDALAGSHALAGLSSLHALGTASVRRHVVAVTLELVQLTKALGGYAAVFPATDVKKVLAVLIATAFDETEAEVALTALCQLADQPIAAEFVYQSGALLRLVLEVVRPDASTRHARLCALAVAKTADQPQAQALLERLLPGPVLDHVVHVRESIPVLFSKPCTTATLYWEPRMRDRLAEELTGELDVLGFPVIGAPSPVTVELIADTPSPFDIHVRYPQLRKNFVLANVSATLFVAHSHSGRAAVALPDPEGFTAALCQALKDPNASMSEVKTAVQALTILVLSCPRVTQQILASEGMEEILSVLFPNLVEDDGEGETVVAIVELLFALSSQDGWAALVMRFDFLDLLLDPVDCTVNIEGGLTVKMKLNSAHYNAKLLDLIIAIIANTMRSQDALAQSEKLIQALIALAWDASKEEHVTPKAGQCVVAVIEQALACRKERDPASVARIQAALDGSEFWKQMFDERSLALASDAKALLPQIGRMPPPPTAPKSLRAAMTTDQAQTHLTLTPETVEVIKGRVKPILASRGASSVIPPVVSGLTIPVPVIRTLAPEMLGDPLPIQEIPAGVHADAPSGSAQLNKMPTLILERAPTTESCTPEMLRKQTAEDPVSKRKSFTMRRPRRGRSLLDDIPSTPTTPATAAPQPSPSRLKPVPPTPPAATPSSRGLPPPLPKRTAAASSPPAPAAAKTLPRPRPAAGMSLLDQINARRDDSCVVEGAATPNSTPAPPAPKPKPQAAATTRPAPKAKPGMSFLDQINARRDDSSVVESSGPKPKARPAPKAKPGMSFLDQINARRDNSSVVESSGPRPTTSGPAGRGPPPPPPPGKSGGPPPPPGPSNAEDRGSAVPGGVKASFLDQIRQGGAGGLKPAAKPPATPPAPTGGRASFLDQIKSGGGASMLKPVNQEAAQVSRPASLLDQINSARDRMKSTPSELRTPAPAPAKVDFLSQIKAGSFNLKPVAKEETSKPSHASNSSTLAKELFQAMSKRRNAIEGDSESESESDWDE
ncbi:WH2 domain [Carpediemonas membranifera]|uniref:WH2 domain n=1 Tax=Carpediemonas membranifera TaxID=201153 RepID=A0A8J6B5G7_9EUKA|nr:WH2 domain [Carpediemonas membranifera]|eukprot:KAG9393434.1 WH2 domain [Carpediemonas membranifera]